MTDEKDFKRLVRTRMRKTGESYTTARAHLRRLDHPGATVLDVGQVRERLLTRQGLDRLADHLSSQYRIEVAGLTELDLGVFRVHRTAAHPDWVVRVFPRDRPLDEVRGDAEILDLLASRRFPAERLADPDPTSVLEDQPVLVTEYIDGSNARMALDGETLYRLGDLLGRLHTTPVSGRTAALRPAGAWHHLSPAGGTVQDDFEMLQELVARAKVTAGPEESEHFEVIAATLDELAPPAGLPSALIHPQPGGANSVVAADSGDLVFIDWAGAGTGPRMWSLAMMLAGVVQPVPGSWPPSDLRLLEAVVAGYRQHVRLDQEELAALGGSMAACGLLIATWSVLFQDQSARWLASGVAGRRRQGARAAERVARAFEAEAHELTSWFRPEALPEDPRQGRLL